MIVKIKGFYNRKLNDGICVLGKGSMDDNKVLVRKLFRNFRLKVEVKCRELVRKGWIWIYSWRGFILGGLIED